MLIATTTARMPQPAVMPCPACGGLECLCRPRWFAGQLITEEDLNRLDHYITGKNKLYNRHLHGWGVVCGLEVLCHPCEGFVLVKSGYALSPCGDDIVVCRDEAVNVCDLIKRCRDDMQRQWDCEPAWPQPQPDCEQEQSWVLYLCYDEKPSRGITALRGGSGAACCSRCSCGGSSSCGCGCHEKMNGQTKLSWRPPPPKTPPQCEPTITCEGYTFQIRKAPKTTPSSDPGTMINRIADCLKNLAGLQQALSGLGNVTQPLNTVDAATLSTINAIKEELRELLDQHGIQNCALYQKILQPLLQSVPVGTPGPVLISDVQQYFRLLFEETLQECICSALLPPCPAPVEENCVPIATVTVNCKNGCRIVRVCNWENRRIVLTFPSLEYWFESLLRQAGVPQFVAGFCCVPPQRESNFFRNLLNATVANQGNVSSQSVFAQLGAIWKGFLSKLTGNL